MSLSSGDRSSTTLRRVYSPPLSERIKGPLRRLVYPPLVSIRDRLLRKKYDAPFHVDHWLLGQRGNDYAAHRRRVNSFKAIRGSDILVVGCGTGYDAPSWLPWHPASVSGCDYFDYHDHWSDVQQIMRGRSPNTKVTFMQADAKALANYDDSSFDFYSSDAVLEHVSDLHPVMSEAHRVLRPHGLFYSTWGALWNAFAGDHCSGYDGLAGGYNHLLLDKPEYDAYLEGMGPYTHDPDDGRTWVINKLFSYLRPLEYMDIIREKFDVQYTALVLDPRGVRFLLEYPEKADRLRAICPVETDLLIGGITVIARPR